MYYFLVSIYVYFKFNNVNANVFRSKHVAISLLIASFICYSLIFFLTNIILDLLHPAIFYSCKYANFSFDRLNRGVFFLLLHHLLFLPIYDSPILCTTQQNHQMLARSGTILSNVCSLPTHTKCMGREQTFPGLHHTMFRFWLSHFMFLLHSDTSLERWNKKHSRHLA